MKNILNNARHKTIAKAKDNNSDLYEQVNVSAPGFITQKEPPQRSYMFFKNWFGRQKYLKRLLETQLARLEIVKTLEMTDLRPSKDKSLANYAKHINKLIQTIIDEELKQVEENTCTKISYGWLLNDENEVKQEILDEIRAKRSRRPSAMYDQALETDYDQEKAM